MVQQHTKNSSESNRGFIDVLLNVSDVATFLGVAAKTVHKLVREKKLACVQVTSRDRPFTSEQVQEGAGHPTCLQVLRKENDGLVRLGESNPIRDRRCNE
jgi:hypothetical protein